MNPMPNAPQPTRSRPRPIPTAGMSPRKIVEEIDKWVVGQRRAKRVMALAFWNHIVRTNDAIANGGQTDLKKANVMMVGPTGVGKTHIARTLARVVGLPMVVADATEYTEAGYYGKDVEVMIAELLHSCELDVSACERGIVFIDEVDKIARKNGGTRTGAGNRDIGGEGVQQSILKLLEGRKTFVPMNVTQHWNKHDFVEVDTANILFVCAGTFTDAREEREKGGGLGFGNEVSGKKPARRISQKTLVEAGMLPELLGRLPIVVQLDPLGAGDLARILTEPQDALIKEYVRLLDVQGVKLEFPDESVKAVADFAAKRGRGARGLRAVMEEVLHDVLFDAAENPGQTVTVSPGDVAAKLAEFDSGMSAE